MVGSCAAGIPARSNLKDQAEASFSPIRLAAKPGAFCSNAWHGPCKEAGQLKDETANERKKSAGKMNDRKSTTGINQ